MIAKFEFKVTVSLWAKCTQMWPLKLCCISSFAKGSTVFSYRVVFCYISLQYSWLMRRLLLAQTVRYKCTLTLTISISLSPHTCTVHYALLALASGSFIVFGYNIHIHIFQIKKTFFIILRVLWTLKFSACFVTVY